MKRNGRKSSNIVDAMSDESRAKEEKKTRMLQSAVASPRTLVNEPVAYNQDKNDEDRINANLFNPGYNENIIKKHPFKDPEPQKLSKGKKRKNYGDIPTFEFFKHTTSSK